MVRIQISRAAPESNSGVNLGDRRCWHILKGLGGCGAMALLICAPFFIYPIFLMKLLCYAIFACAFNLVLGYSRLLSFGHATFFGTGSYLAAWGATSLGWSPLVALCAGAMIGACFGAAFGWIAIRRQGLYFAMITLALAQMVYFACLHLSFTHGEDGIQNVPRGGFGRWASLSPDLNMYWFVVACFLVVFFLALRIVRSPFGAVVKAIGENEARATSLGYRVESYKLIVFILSASISGFAGALKTLIFGIATLNDVSMSTSSDVVLMTLIGGVGTVLGPLCGSLVMTSAEQYFAQIGGWMTVLQGAVFVLCVLLFRQGIVGALEALVHRISVRHL